MRSAEREHCISHSCNVISSSSLNDLTVLFILISFSGLLVGYLAFRRMEKNDGRLPLFQFYFHRFWRYVKVFSIEFVFQIYANLSK